MRRRTYLTGVAAIATSAIAGCSGDGGDGDGDGDQNGDNGGPDGSSSGGGSSDSGGDSNGSDDTGDGSGDTDGGDSDGQSNGEGDGEGGDPSGGSEPTELSTIASVGYNDPQPEEFSGSGQSVTDAVALDGGLVVSDFEHRGESNFIVEMWDEVEGERHDNLANVIGNASGQSATAVQGGDYSMDIDADGEWSVTLAQPVTAPSDAHTPPVTASGEGPTVVGPVNLQGSATATGSHDGDGNFIVHVWDELAVDILGRTLVFNELDDVEEAETRFSHDGVGWIAVNAGGEWELSIE